MPTGVLDLQHRCSISYVRFSFTVNICQVSAHAGSVCCVRSAFRLRGGGWGWGIKRFCLQILIAATETVRLKEKCIRKKLCGTKCFTLSSCRQFIEPFVRPSHRLLYAIMTYLNSPTDFRLHLLRLKLETKKKKKKPQSEQRFLGEAVDLHLRGLNYLEFTGRASRQQSSG